MKLENRTLQEFMDSIGIEDLPKTMIDAISLVRDLGLRFLWIDSLCIVKDDATDWQAQSVQMGSVYQHAQINIAATASKTSQGGLFFNRDSRAVQLIQIKCRFPFWDTSKPMSLYNITDQIPCRIPIEFGYLNSRGWVMQERLLSPRTLHCTEEQLFWECIESHANESYPSTFQAALQEPPGRFYRMLSNFSCQYTVSQTLHIPRIHKAWLSLVQEYSARNLTKDADILIAFSGIAKLWKRAVPDQYIAGYWRSSLPICLPWRREQNLLSSGAPSKIWRAPSWSWASFNGAVQWSENVIEGTIQRRTKCEGVLVELLEARVQGVSEDETAQLLSAELVLRGGLVAGMAGFKFPHDNSDEGVARRESVLLLLDHGVFATKMIMNTNKQQYKGLCVFDTDERTDVIRREGFVLTTCLPVILLRSNNEATKDRGAYATIGVEGILLEKIDLGMNQKEAWKRVGYFELSGEPGDIEKGDTLVAALLSLLDRSNIKDTIEALGFGEVEDILLI